MPAGDGGAWTCLPPGQSEQGPFVSAPKPHRPSIWAWWSTDEQWVVGQAEIAEQSAAAQPNNKTPQNHPSSQCSRCIDARQAQAARRLTLSDWAGALGDSAASLDLLFLRSRSLETFFWSFSAWEAGRHSETVKQGGRAECIRSPGWWWLESGIDRGCQQQREVVGGGRCGGCESAELQALGGTEHVDSNSNPHPRAGVKCARQVRSGSQEDRRMMGWHRHLFGEPFILFSLLLLRRQSLFLGLLGRLVHPGQRYPVL